jgi:hypothetical protein
LRLFFWRVARGTAEDSGLLEEGDLRFLLVAIISVGLFPSQSLAEALPASGRVEAHFSDTTKGIVQEILRAKTEVLIEAFSFTSSSIIQARAKGSPTGSAR